MPTSSKAGKSDGDPPVATHGDTRSHAAAYITDGASVSVSQSERGKQKKRWWSRRASEHRRKTEPPKPRVTPHVSLLVAGFNQSQQYHRALDLARDIAKHNPSLAVLNIGHPNRSAFRQWIKSSPIELSQVRCTLLCNPAFVVHLFELIKM